MKSRGLNYTLLAVILALLLFLLSRRNEPRAKEAFDRNPTSIHYTKHALCRMDCREISKSDIKEILQRGIINFNKSNKFDKPCPTYAIQGETMDGEKIRVILAQCDKETRIITCYNLVEDFECDCPGDKKKN